MKKEDLERAALLNSDDDDDEQVLDVTSKPTSVALTSTTASSAAAQRDPKISRLQGQVDDVIGDMRITVDKVVERGHNLTELSDRSEQLGAVGDMFSKRSRNLRKTMGVRTCRARLYLGLSILFVFILAIFFLYRTFRN